MLPFSMSRFALRRNVLQYIHEPIECAKLKKGNFQTLLICTMRRLATRRDCTQQQRVIPANHFVRNKSDYSTSDDEENNNKFEEEYKKSIDELNTLQSNANSIRRSIALGNKQIPLADMHEYLKRSGLSLEDLDNLSFIHVSGTKGKGTTCALTESILREYGYKTGFFSSPHLVSVTERIRINGLPVSKEKFVKTFRHVYDRLMQTTKPNAVDMPPYFKFLTILCFHIFLEERVDVAILEVGIGGELDSTNIIRNTKTIGITSLGLEHTQLLGDTIEQIAFQKSGIIKKHADVYTTVTHSSCLDVLNRRAAEKQATLHIVPALENYTYHQSKDFLCSLNSVVLLNGSLAVQLALDWLRKRGKDCMADEWKDRLKLNDTLFRGLLKCHWPGRCQIIKFRNLNIHLDGAHTLESIQVCGKWVQQVIGNSANPRVLIFNTTGDRDSKKLITALRQYIDFNSAHFVPNIVSGNSNQFDNRSMQGLVDQMKRVNMHADIWCRLCIEDEEQDNSRCHSSILEAISEIHQTYDVTTEVDVVVTGSLHLIGSMISALSQYKQNLELPNQRVI